MADRHAPEAADEFHAMMRQVGVEALWERHGLNSREPVSEAPHHWKWTAVEPLIDRAVQATSMDSAERRVLSFANPDLDNRRGARVTTNLNCGLQVLMPGESARPHRHSANALRFVLEGSGARTIVDGKDCPMHLHDLILTPGWSWHEHTHEGEGRVVWLDALDVPFHRSLDSHFFEPGPTHDVPALPADSAYGGGGVVPQSPPGAAAPGYSPLFRYPWADVEAAFAAMPAADDGARKVRYTNPATGGAAMGLLDCFAIALPKGRATMPYRTTANAFCLVVEGEGVSTVGEAKIAWSRHDVFTLPHWNWISHKAASDDARLFMVTDREILRRLDLLREEVRS
jgi:gentisate 1,2-dioxygenase